MVKNIQILPNTKFQTAQIGCFFKMPVTSENIAKSSLLGYFQSNISLAFQNLSAQETALRENYDLDFRTRRQLIGNQLIISYNLNFIEPSTIADPNYTYESIIDLFQKLVLEPDFVASGSQFFDLAKNELLSDLEDILDDPRNQALSEFNQIYYRDRPEYQNIFGGDLELIKTCKFVDLEGFFSNLLDFPALIVGMAQKPNVVVDQLAEKFGPKVAGLTTDFTQTKLKRAPSKLAFVEKISEHQTNQAQLIVGYAYQNPVKNRLIGITVANYLTGGEYSILFQKVREDLGAAYGISATANNNQNQLVISAGLEKEKVAEVIKVIQDEIAALKNGRIDEEVLAQTKNDLVRAFKIQEDQQQNIIKKEFAKNLTGKSHSTAENIQLLKEITPSEIAEFVNNLDLKERYLMV